MEQALAMLTPADDAAVALPSDLHHFAVFDQNGHACADRRSQIAHAMTRDRVGLDVVFHKLDALPLQPLPHVLRIRTTGRAKELKLGHGSILQSFANDVIDRRLHFLNAWNVVGPDTNGKSANPRRTISPPS